MLVLSRTSRKSLVFRAEDGLDRSRKAAFYDAEDDRYGRDFEGDAEVSAEQMEMLERIRVAAGRTS